MNIDIRWMITRDLPEVLHIENRSFADPWEEFHFLQCMRETSCIGLVAELLPKPGSHYRECQIVGYVIYKFAARYIDLFNLAVLPEVRRNGIGRQLVERLAKKLTPRRRVLLSEVSDANLPAHLFFHAVGMRATSVIRQPYETSDSDAYRFTRRYQPDPAAQADQQLAAIRRHQ